MLRAVLLALLLTATPDFAQDNGHGATDPRLHQSVWQRFGPIGPRSARLVAVSPDWPTDPLLLAARPQSSTFLPGRTETQDADVVRSRDGGRSWESLPSPATALNGLLLAKAPGNALAAFAWSDDALFLSNDAGTTWQTVMTTENSTVDEFRLSPNLGNDGLAFAIASGALWRSRDAGQTWQSLDPRPGQWIHRIRFSPDFANDNTILAGLAGGPFPIGGPASNNASAPTGDPDTSAGVLVSTDAGNTWTAINNGLQADSNGYQAIQELEISPTFARDSTLLAVGWGPYERVPFYGSDAPAQRAGLFRSQDRGASWELVQGFDPSVTRFNLHLAISPDFADDNVVLHALNITGPTPNSSNCTVSRSSDAGSTWTDELLPGNYEACTQLQAFGAGSGFEAMVLKSSTRYWSPDGGQSWAPASTPTSLSEAVTSPAYADDHTLFLPGIHGVWSNGPNVVATDGMLPCAVTPTLGFGRVWSSNPDVRATLGCALDPERSMPVREREYSNPFCGPTRVLWPDDQSVPFFYELSDSSCGPGNLRIQEKAKTPLPDGPEHTVPGALEAFEGGDLLFLAEPDARRLILVLSNSSQWQEFPDAPAE